MDVFHDSSSVVIFNGSYPVFEIPCPHSRYRSGWQYPFRMANVFGLTSSDPTFHLDYVSNS